MKAMKSKVQFCCYSNLSKPLNGYKTDSSWGCTLRNFQSLVLSFTAQNDNKKSLKDMYNNELSIVNIIEQGQMEAGKWSGPIKVALTLSKTLPFIKMYSQEIKPTQDDLILVPMRLGMDKLETMYHSELSKSIVSKSFVGMVCGKGGSSLLVNGVDKSSGTLMYLDPHYFRASNVNENFRVPLGQWKKELTFEELEPTVVVAFRGDKELNELLSAFPIYSSNVTDTSSICKEDELDDFVVLDYLV
jgi:hypothetical protein